MKRYFLKQDEDNNVYVSNFLEVKPDNSIEFYANNFIKPKFDKFPEPTTLIEGATQEEIEEYNKPFVPAQLSRMKFIIQVFITTGIKYEDIVLFIQNLTFDEAQKYVILTRLRSATHFERNSTDLQTISAMMEITQEQLDEIFINGNLIE